MLLNVLAVYLFTYLPRSLGKRYIFSTLGIVRRQLLVVVSFGMFVNLIVLVCHFY